MGCPPVLGRSRPKNVCGPSNFSRIGVFKWLVQQNHTRWTVSPTPQGSQVWKTHFRKQSVWGLPWSLFAVGAQRQGQPRLPPRLQRGWLPQPQAEMKNCESSPRFPAQGVTAQIPLSIPLPPVLRDG
jgi:hypothetical protein